MANAPSDHDIFVNFYKRELELATESGQRAEIKISEEEYRDHANAYDGVCLGCGEWTIGGCEPDARKYKCDACGAMRVYGCEEALLMGRIAFVDEEAQS